LGHSQWHVLSVIRGRFHHELWFGLVGPPRSVSFGLSVAVKWIGPVKCPKAVNFMAIILLNTFFKKKTEKELQDVSQSMFYKLQLCKY